MNDKKKTYMQELDSYINKRDKHLIIESRGSNIIESAINLIEQIRASFSEKEALELERRLIGSIKNENPIKFKRKIREYRDKERTNKDD